VERGLPVKATAALRALARLGLCLIVSLPLSAAADDKLVLLVGTGSPLATLGSVELHKLFLGLTVVVDDHRLHALRNDSDELMRQVFFQNIVSMSESVYDRRMLAMTLQQVGRAPPVLRDSKTVFERLAEDPDAVSFGWAADASKDPRVKALRVLWHP